MPKAYISTLKQFAPEFHALRKGNTCMTEIQIKGGAYNMAKKEVKKQEQSKLVIIKSKQAVCGSTDVAEQFGKKHKNVLKIIDKIIKESGGSKLSRENDNQSAQFGADYHTTGEVKKMFKESLYTDSRGKQQRMYHMNRDGFTLLVMGFTGAEAMEWKLRYIEAFNWMESRLDMIDKPGWKRYRAEAIETRKAETDAIKDFVEYARSHGSSHPDMYYKHFTSLINGLVSLDLDTGREMATAGQQLAISTLEAVLEAVLPELIDKDLPYKEIYAECKRELAESANFIMRRDKSTT